MISKIQSQSLSFVCEKLSVEIRFLCFRLPFYYAEVQERETSNPLLLTNSISDSAAGRREQLLHLMVPPRMDDP